MDEEFVERRPGDLETYRRLDAFAHVRLAPNAASMARIRTSLVAEATRRADMLGDQDVTAHVVVPLQRNRGWSLPRRRVSRAVTALLAAALTLGMVAGSVAASSPGGPLYGPRLWLEQVTLPTGAVERADAQVERLDHRLAEVRTALASGDPAATSAALDAYAAILGELDAQAGADPAVADRVLDDVTRHLGVLQALIGHVPPQAQDALHHALDRSDAALDHLTGAGSAGNGSGRPATPGAGGGSGGTGGNGATERTPPAVVSTPKPPKPDATPKATQKPARTPSPVEPTAKPAKTAAPEVDDPTPRPGRTPRTPDDPRSGPQGQPTDRG
jgi:hypothetical protein